MGKKESRFIGQILFGFEEYKGNHPTTVKTKWPKCKKRD